MTVYIFQNDAYKINTFLGKLYFVPLHNGKINNKRIFVFKYEIIANKLNKEIVVTFAVSKANIMVHKIWAKLLICISG